MSCDLSKLPSSFLFLIQRLIQNCKDCGVEMRPYCSVRDPFEQAIYWRQSRTREEIESKIKFLYDNGGKFLSDIIRVVGPRNGPKVTDAIPGYSFHQYGMAVDLFWVVDGCAEWSTTKKINGKNGYVTMALEASVLGLYPGGYFKKLKDWPHVQLYDSIESAIGGLSGINDKMESIYKEEYLKWLKKDKR